MNRKPIFDYVRNLLGRGFTQSEVDQFNALLEGRQTPDTPSLAQTNKKPRRTSRKGIELLHRFEGCHRKLGDGMVKAYPDPGTGGAPWTIGWGSTRDGLHGFVRSDTVWTQQQCDERFVDDLRKFEKRVEKALGSAIASTSQEQFDALVSFDYNTGAIHRATLTRKHIAGDHAGAAREFLRWNRAGGRVMRGLTRRRQAEAALYRKGM